MTDEEKFIFIGELLKKHHHSFNDMTSDTLKDYVELMAMFLKTQDDTILQASFDTMDRIVQKTLNR